LTRVVAALALLCVAFAPAAARACAGCSNPNLQGARALDAGAGRGRLDLGAGLVATTMRVVHAEACPEIGPICAARDEPPQLHDQRFYSAELRLFGALGLTESLGVEVQVPLRLLWRAQHNRDAERRQGDSVDIGCQLAFPRTGHGILKT